MTNSSDRHISSEAVILITTCGSREEAEAIARAAVEARLAACVQISAIDSVYRWDGAVQVDSEWRLDMKTTGDRQQALADLVRERHSYDVPEIVILPIIAGLPAYLDWMKDETRG